MQTEEQMLRTLHHLRDVWMVDISQAQGLAGESLWDWLQKVGTELVEREYARSEAEGKRVSRIINDPIHGGYKKWWIRFPTTE